MLYTQFGDPVNILNAREEEQQSPRGDTYPTYFVRLEYAEDLQDGSAKAGDLLFDGQYENAAMCLRADNGWSEILDEIESARNVGRLLAGVSA